MKKVLLFLTMLILLVIPVNATIINYPTPYYYNGKENIKVDQEYLKQFEDMIPEVKMLEFTYSTKDSIRYGGYTYCYYYGRIEVTIYLSQWKEDNYWITRNMIEHELKHIRQCLNGELPNHGDSFYE